VGEVSLLAHLGFPLLVKSSYAIDFLSKHDIFLNIGNQCIYALYVKLFRTMVSNYFLPSFSLTLSLKGLALCCESSDSNFF